MCPVPLLSSLHQGSLLTKPRSKPVPDASPVSDCAVCLSCSQGGAHFNQSCPSPALPAAISAGLSFHISALCLNGLGLYLISYNTKSFEEPQHKVEEKAGAGPWFVFLLWLFCRCCLCACWTVGVMGLWFAVFKTPVFLIFTALKYFSDFGEQGTKSSMAFRLQCSCYICLWACPQEKEVAKRSLPGWPWLFQSTHFIFLRFKDSQKFIVIYTD